MVKYRKRPVVIEAEQWFPGRPVDGVREIETGDPFTKIVGQVDTLEGVMTVIPGDWIITGVKGEKYPCKPDIFALTYEPLEVDALSTEPSKTAEKLARQWLGDWIDSRFHSTSPTTMSLWFTRALATLTKLMTDREREAKVEVLETVLTQFWAGEGDPDDLIEEAIANSKVT